MTSHYRQASHASSFVSTSANTSSALGINRKSHIPKIGPWKIGKPLGNGSTGRVFLATNSQTMQKAAVKIIPKDALMQGNNESANDSSHELSYGIEREIIIMKLLNHRNVLRLYDVWETDKQLYLILEYVEGGELFDLLVESGPLPEATAINFFKQIILGASYCHNLGICHRDLKPENILLDKDLNIKIADFGMAALESGRLLETSCGSPHYAAPEIVSGLQYHGAESDVWSCGVVLFAILTGRLPFDDDNIRDLLLKVQVGKYEIIEDLSPDAKDLIHKMLTVDPTKRIKTNDILRHPLITKYYNCDDDEDFIKLPNPTLTNQLTRDTIDEKILENLIILWHGRSKDSIIDALLSNESTTPEKTFYSLLLQYRHEHSSSDDRASGDGLVRSSSIISKATNSTSNISNSSSKKRFSFTASSAGRRPTSFQSFKNSRSSTSFNAPPISGPAYQDYLLKTSTANNSNASSPGKEILPHSNSNSSKSQRNSMLFSGNGNASILLSPSKRASVLSSLNELRLPPLPPQQPRVSKLKRNSITSKVLNQYAKMAEYDQKKNPDDFGKRTSQDFAKLCDALFNDGSKRDVQLPDSQSMATINAIVFGNSNKRQSKRLSMAKQRIQLPEISNELPPTPTRNSSDPVSKISKILNGDDRIQRRAVSEINPPPKPMSKLDPRYKAYDAYEKRVSQDAAKLLAEAEAKAVQEEIDRLEQEQLELAEKEAAALAEAEALKTAQEEEEAELRASNTVVRNRQVPTRLSDVYVPPVARLSRIGDKSRYSVLSMYSTKQSSNRLSFYLRELDDEIAKTNLKKNERYSRMSMIPLDEDDETMNRQSWGTVEDVEDDTEVTSVDKTKSALVSPVMGDAQDEDELFFVDKGNETNTSSYYPTIDNITNSNDDHNLIKDSFITNYSEDIENKVNKLPEIPGSPETQKMGRSNTNGTFEVFEDAVRKSKQEFESPEKFNQQPQQVKALDIEKQRKPLNETNDYIKGNKRKSSFFRNLSQGSTPPPAIMTRRKSSFGETLKALFSSQSSAKPITFDTILSIEDGFEAIKSLLVGWKGYGIGNLNIDKSHNKIDASVLKSNSLNLKPVKFSCHVMESGKGMSKLVFSHTKGSSKSFEEIIKATRKILINEDVLA